MKVKFAAIALSVTGALHMSAPLAQDAATITWDQLLANMDPHTGGGFAEVLNITNLYDSLYRFEGNPPVAKPWLAVSHTVSPDGKTWEFKLRPGVKFHDGTPLTSADVVYSFQRAIAVRRGAAAPLLDILKPENVTAVDSVTVRMTLEKPSGFFMSVIPGIAVVNSALVKKSETNGDWGQAWLSSNEAGSGAYALVPGTFKPSVYYEIRRNPNHFLGWSDNPRPVELVRLRPSGEIANTANAVIKGAVDVTHNYLEADHIERIEKAAPTVNIHRDKSLRIAYLIPNTTKPPLDNVHFRRCIAYAINYDAIIKQVLGQAAVRSLFPVPDGMWGAPKTGGYVYDMAKAKMECDAAKAQGAPIDKEFTFHAMTTIQSTSVIGQVLQADLKKLGVNMKVAQQTWPNLMSMAASKETAPDLWMTWISAYYPDPDNWIGAMFDSSKHGSWRSSAFYKNTEVDKLLQEARTTMDQKARASIYEKVSTQVMSDAAAFPLFTNTDLRATSARIEGFVYDPVTFGQSVRNLRMKQ